eukprot:gene27980-biopygen5926
MYLRTLSPKAEEDISQTTSLPGTREVEAEDVVSCQNVRVQVLANVVGPRANEIRLRLKGVHNCLVGIVLVARSYVSRPRDKYRSRGRMFAADRNCNAAVTPIWRVEFNPWREQPAHRVLLDDEVCENASAVPQDPRTWLKNAYQAAINTFLTSIATETAQEATDAYSHSNYGRGKKGGLGLAASTWTWTLQGQPELRGGRERTSTRFLGGTRLEAQGRARGRVCSFGHGMLGTPEVPWASIAGRDQLYLQDGRLLGAAITDLTWNDASLPMVETAIRACHGRTCMRGIGEVTLAIGGADAVSGTPFLPRHRGTSSSTSSSRPAVLSGSLYCLETSGRGGGPKNGGRRHPLASAASGSVWVRDCVNASALVVDDVSLSGDGGVVWAVLPAGASDIVWSRKVGAALSVDCLFDEEDESLIVALHFGTFSTHFEMVTFDQSLSSLVVTLPASGENVVVASQSSPMTPGNALMFRGMCNAVLGRTRRAIMAAGITDSALFMLTVSIEDIVDPRASRAGKFVFPGPTSFEAPSAFNEELVVDGDLFVNRSMSVRGSVFLDGPVSMAPLGPSVRLSDNALTVVGQIVFRDDGRGFLLVGGTYADEEDPRLLFEGLSHPDTAQRYYGRAQMGEVGGGQSLVDAAWMYADGMETRDRTVGTFLRLSESIKLHAGQKLRASVDASGGVLVLANDGDSRFPLTVSGDAPSDLVQAAFGSSISRPPVAPLPSYNGNAFGERGWGALVILGGEGGGVMQVSDVGVALDLNPAAGLLRPCTYTHRGVVEAGFIAQEVFCEVPEMRHLISLPRDFEIDDDNTLGNAPVGSVGLNYVGIIAYLVSAMQEQAKKIEDLQARIAK